MVLGSRAQGQRCPVETPEAARARRAARVARNRKASQMQSGEGARKSSPPDPTDTSTSTSATSTTATQPPAPFRPRPPKTKPKESKDIAEVQEQLKKAEDDLEKKNDEYDTVLITFETMNKEFESVKEKLGEITKQFQELSSSNEILTNELAATKIDIEELTQKKKVLVDSLTEIVHPSGKPSAEKLAGLMTELWNDRDVIFQEVKSDLSKTRAAKEEAQAQAQRDADALRATLDPTKTKDHLIAAQKRSKILSEERNKALIEIEELKNEKEDLVIQNIGLTNQSAEIFGFKEEIITLKRELRFSNENVTKHESTILLLEGEKEDLIKQIEQMNSETGLTQQGNPVSDEELEDLKRVLCEVRYLLGLSQNTPPEETVDRLQDEWRKREEIRRKYEDQDPIKVDKGMQVEIDIGDQGDAVNKLQILLSEVKSITGLSKDLSPEDSAEEFRKAWEGKEKSYKNLMEREKKKETRRIDAAAKKNKEQIQKLLSEVRTMTGLPEATVAEDSVEKLQQAWQKQESRCLKAQEFEEKNNELLAKIKFLTESIGTITHVEPGELSIEELIEELQNRDVRQSIKIGGLVAEVGALEDYQRTPKKDKIEKFRKTCMAIAKEVHIKHKDKTKVPEYLTLFRKELTKQAELVTSLEKKVAKKNEQIEELLASLEEMGDELDKPSTGSKNKKKKKKFFRKIINKIARKQTSDEMILMIADQANTIKSLKKSQKNYWDYREENRDLLDKISSLKNQIECQDNSIVELKYSVKQEKEIVEHLHDCIRFFEERKQLSPVDVPRHHDRTLSDLLVVAQFRGRFQNFEILDREKDLKPFDENRIDQDRYPLKYLAGGAYGEITIARLASNGKCVVVKRPIVPSFLSAAFRDDEVKANLLCTLKEAMICEYFERSKFFPTIHGIMTIDNQTCLVLDFIGDHDKGVDRTLFNFIKQKDRELPLIKKKDVTTIARDIVEAVEALHERRLLHNDIKPNNVMMEQRNSIWRAILIDFGQASTLYFPLRKDYSETTRKLYDDGQIHQHLAPEIVMRGRPSSYVSDIFSMGQLFRMMGRDCGIPPLEALGDKCCRDNQAHRPQTATEILPMIDAITFQYLVTLRPKHKFPYEGNEQVPSLPTP
nr:chromosome-associated kinesin KIF4-like [Lytechinus pictus]